MAKPLEGIKVLELARILAGPWAGQTLADLGAEVIKVESPDGDDTRTWGPPFVPGRDGAPDVAAYFHCCNRGKRSITADFRNEADLARVRELAATADVVIENFKLGGLKRFGLDYDTIANGNPGVVYASITGFGQDGPYAARAGYDFLIQGMGGAMSVTGEQGGRPTKIGFAAADVFTGLYATIGILAAIQERGRTGKGAHVDAALLDTMVSVMANQPLNYLVSGKDPEPLGNAHPNVVPYDVFPTSDGHAIIAVGNDAQFRRLGPAIGRPDLVDDPRFRTNSDRVANRDDLTELIGDATTRLTRDELLAALGQAQVAGGPINRMSDVFDNPQVVSRGMRIDPHGPVPGVRTPLVISGEPCAHDRGAPALGADNEHVVGWSTG